MKNHVADYVLAFYGYLEVTKKQCRQLGSACCADVYFSILTFNCVMYISCRGAFSLDGFLHMYILVWHSLD